MFGNRFICSLLVQGCVLGKSVQMHLALHTLALCEVICCFVGNRFCCAVWFNEAPFFHSILISHEINVISIWIAVHTHTFAHTFVHVGGFSLFVGQSGHRVGSLGCLGVAVLMGCPPLHPLRVLLRFLFCVFLCVSGSFPWAWRPHSTPLA